MADVKETEQRLRSYLRADQAAQEAMCLALLPILGPFTDCSPRRPQGGADQGRDIESIYRERVVTWGAVGFSNDATKADRSWAARKFRKDLATALGSNPSLKGFVFFTNVDVTPAAAGKLKTDAVKKGLQFVEIYAFARLVQVLNSVDGLLVRLQYLQIAMSPDEQASLMHRFGGKLQMAVASRFDRVEALLQRVEYLIDSTRLVREVEVEFQLQQDQRGSLPSTTSVMLVFRNNWTSQTIALLAEYLEPQSLKQQKIMFNSNLWVASDPELLTPFSGYHTLSKGTKIKVGFPFFLIDSFHLTVATLLQDTEVRIYCTRGLAQLLTGVRLFVNDYHLLEKTGDVGSLTFEEEVDDLPLSSRAPPGILRQDWCGISMLVYYDDLSSNPPLRRQD